MANVDPRRRLADVSGTTRFAIGAASSAAVPIGAAAALIPLRDHAPATTVALNRHHRNQAAEVSYDLGRLHGVAEMVASGAPVDQVVLAVANELTDLLGLQSCRFDEEFAETVGPFVERHGSVTWGELRWGIRTMGLPNREVSLLVQYQGRRLGRYVLVAAPGGRVSANQLLAAVALADQVGAALHPKGHRYDIE